MGNHSNNEKHKDLCAGTVFIIISAFKTYFLLLVVKTVLEITLLDKQITKALFLLILRMSGVDASQVICHSPTDIHQRVSKDYLTYINTDLYF